MTATGQLMIAGKKYPIFPGHNCSNVGRIFNVRFIVKTIIRHHLWPMTANRDNNYLAL